MSIVWYGKYDKSRLVEQVFCCPPFYRAPDLALQKPRDKNGVTLTVTPFFHSFELLIPVLT